jgi:hypothetical protein
MLAREGCDVLCLDRNLTESLLMLLFQELLLL